MRGNYDERVRPCQGAELKKAEKGHFSEMGGTGDYCNQTQELPGHPSLRNRPTIGDSTRPHLRPLLPLSPAPVHSKAPTSSNCTAPSCSRLASACAYKRGEVKRWEGGCTTEPG